MPRCGAAECTTWRPDLFVRRSHRGATLDGVWYCSLACVERAAATRLRAGLRPRRLAGRITGVAAPGAGIQSVTRARAHARLAPLPPLKVGMLLVNQGALSPAVLQDALETQRASGRRLGAELLHRGLVTREQLLRALAAQAGVPYLLTIDPRSAQHVPSALTPTAIRALGLVPFSADPVRRRLRVATAAPIPRLALQALAELTGWIGDPFLVDDQQLERLLDACDPIRPGRAAAPASGVVSVSAAASRIAQRAITDREASMEHVHCAPFMWVRVESTAGPEDLIVAATEQEQRWQAEHTSR